MIKILNAILTFINLFFCIYSYNEGNYKLSITSAIAFGIGFAYILKQIIQNESRN